MRDILKSMFKRIVLTGTLLLLFFASVLYVAPVSFSGNLLAAVGGSPYGGRVVSITRCNFGILVRLKPAGSSPDTVMWTPGTKGYLYNLSAPPKPGEWELGMLGGVSTCVVGSGKSLTTIGSGKTILFYGSSK